MKREMQLGTVIYPGGERAAVVRVEAMRDPIGCGLYRVIYRTEYRPLPLLSPARLALWQRESLAIGG